MKRTFLATFLSIIFAMVAVACHSSDEKEIGYTELPVQAQQFVKQYFPTATYTYVEKEKDNGKWEYEATLSDGTKIDFNNKGVMKEKNMPIALIKRSIFPMRHIWKRRRNSITAMRCRLVHLLVKAIHGDRAL